MSSRPVLPRRATIQGKMGRFLRLLLLSITTLVTHPSPMEIGGAEGCLQRTTTTMRPSGRSVAIAGLGNPLFSLHRHWEKTALSHGSYTVNSSCFTTHPPPGSQGACHLQPLAHRLRPPELTRTVVLSTMARPQSALSLYAQRIGLPVSCAPYTPCLLHGLRVYVFPWLLLTTWRP